MSDPHAGLGPGRRNADVLNTDFVVSYVEASGAVAHALAYAAPRCRRLGRDLADMAAAGLLSRTRTGLTDAGEGFPRGVWVYELAPEQG